MFRSLPRIPLSLFCTFACLMMASACNRSEVDPSGDTRPAGRAAANGSTPATDASSGADALPPTEASPTTSASPAANGSAAAPKRPKAVRPASLAEAVGVIDLRRFPRLAGADRVDASAVRLYYEAPGTRAEAVEFCRSELTAAGWKHDTEQDMRTTTDAFLHFHKQGFLLQVFVSSSRSGKSVRVTLENRGNVDARELPRMADARLINESPLSVYYSTQASAAETVQFLKSKLIQAGWTPYVDEASDLGKDTEEGSLRFLQRGVHLEMYVAGQERPCKVNHAVKMPEVEFPLPPDATDVIWQGYPLRIEYLSQQELQQGIELIEQHAGEQGWTRMPEHDGRLSDRARMVFQRSEERRLVFTVMPYKKGRIGVVGVDVATTHLARLLKEHPLDAGAE
ncbi:MAG: hypothetical protein ACYSWU_18470, partial [Planctomycetota bacterium]